jgi:cob(I)alamin adenosyltransferase
MRFFYFRTVDTGSNGKGNDMIIVNTGNGKGKTTAAVGQIIRSLGRGWKVCLIQLFKGKEFYGEQKILTKLKGLDFYSYAPKHPFCFPDVPAATVRAQCAEALAQFARVAARKKPYGLIVLEEFNIALRDRFIALADLVAVLDTLPPGVTVVITGRGAPRGLIRRADLVTEMKEIKHPFSKGVAARKGIEF